MLVPTMTPSVPRIGVLRMKSTEPIDGTYKRGQIFNTESEAQELKGGSETTSGGMRVVLTARFAYDTAIVLT
jgi:hypothetical protein